VKNNNWLEEVLVGALPESYIVNIPEDIYDNKVLLVKDNSKTNSSKFLNSILNKRFVFKQLDLELQETTKRELWYDVTKGLKHDFDLKGTPKQQYISLSEAMKSYCEKLRVYLGFEYWAFVLDYLLVETGERALIWDPKDMDSENESKVMTLKGLDNFEKCPFFLILCEKVATLKPIIGEMIKRGYKEGYYGISMKGYATSVVIKLLLRLRKIRKFRLFVAHDLDQNGLMIYFDMLRYINCQNIGITPEFLELFKIDKEEVSEPFTAKNKNAVIKATIGMIDELEIEDSEKDKFIEWSNYCREEKIELNSISSYNLRRDSSRSKVYDLVDCIETFLNEEGNVWDLNRYDQPIYYSPDWLYKPSVSRPKLIGDIISEIQEKATEKIYEFLKSKNLRDDWNWREIIKEDYEKILEGYNKIYGLSKRIGKHRAKRFIRKNRNYKKSLKKISLLREIDEQDRKLQNLTDRQNKDLKKIRKIQRRIFQRLIKKTPEYKEVEEELTELRDNIIEILENN